MASAAFHLYQWGRSAPTRSLIVAPPSYCFLLLSLSSSVLGHCRWTELFLKFSEASAFEGKMLDKQELKLHMTTYKCNASRSPKTLKTTQERHTGHNQNGRKYPAGSQLRSADTACVTWWANQLPAPGPCSCSWPQLSQHVSAPTVQP